MAFPAALKDVIGQHQAGLSQRALVAWVGNWDSQLLWEGDRQEQMITEWMK